MLKDVFLGFVAALIGALLGVFFYGSYTLMQSGIKYDSDAAADKRKQQQEHLCPLYRLHRGMV